MWIKQLTLDNYQEFVKWSKKAFESIDAVSIPTEYVYRTLGAVKAFEFTGEYQGERHTAAMRTWQTLWVRGGYQEERNILEQRRAYLPMIADILLDDVMNEAPNELYQTYLANGHAYTSILYRFMERSEANAEWVVKRFPHIVQNPVLSGLVNHHESEEEMMARYWETLLSTVRPSNVTINEFLEHAKKHQDAACASCTSKYLEVFVDALGEYEKFHKDGGTVQEVLDNGMRRILTILFQHRPELETFFYQQLKNKNIINVDCAVYHSDEGIQYVRQTLPVMSEKTIYPELWSKWVERWKGELNSLSKDVSISWSTLDAKEVLMEIERCKKYSISLQNLNISLGYSSRGEPSHPVSPLIIGFILNYDAITSLFSIPKEYHDILSVFNKEAFLKECESVLGKKRVQMIKQRWDMAYFTLQGDQTIQETSRYARYIATKGYMHIPNIWYFGRSVWFDGFSDAEFLQDYYDNINIKNNAQPKEEIELLF